MTKKDVDFIRNHFTEDVLVNSSKGTRIKLNKEPHEDFTIYTFQVPSDVPAQMFFDKDGYIYKVIHEGKIVFDYYSSQEEN